MKSKSITFITVLFALMLIGEIAIQAWWIKRSVQLNTAQFDAAAYRALDGVVKQTELKENFTFMQNSISADTVISTTGLHNNVIVKVVHQPQHVVKRMVNGVNNNISLFSTNGKTVVKVESHTGKSSADAQNSDINETVDYIGEKSNFITEKIENLDTLVQKMIHIENHDSFSVKPGYIRQLVKGQLMQSNLPDTFDFALYNPKGKYQFKSAGFIDSAGCYRVSLYPNDLFGRNTLLYVNIPGKLLRINAAIWWAFAMSILFTITLLLLFLYSIKTLISQKKLLAAKNDFINHMSHEIKTPLASIALGADMLIEKPDKMTPAQISKVAQTIKEQSSRLHKDMSAVLMNALVDETPGMNFSSFNIINTIKDSIEEFKLIIQDKQAVIETHFGTDNIILLGNEMLWQKVFTNLLDNSLKFSKNIPVINILASTSGPNTVQIRFSDNGIGINKDDLQRIFEKFYRSDYYQQSNIQGFGLGLSFVQKVVEMHHGKVKAESPNGNGTSITIELPISNG